MPQPSSDTTKSPELQFYAEVSLIQDFDEIWPSEPTKRPKFHSEITIFDETKTPWANQEVKINATETITADVNGHACVIDEKWHTATATTDGNGKIRVVNNAYSLAAPELLFHADFMGKDQRILVRPGKMAQEKLASLDGKQLGAATDYDGALIVKSEYRSDDAFLDAAAKTIKATTDMTRYSQGQAMLGATHTNHHCCDDCDELTCCCCAVESHRCHAVNETNFAVSFYDNLKQGEVNFYENMSAADAKKWVDKRPVSLSFQNKDWNLWDDLKRGVRKIGDAIVYLYEKGSEKVKVVITTLIKKGGEWLEEIAEEVVDTVEHGLILVNAIFLEIAEAADKVLEWLSEEFNFARVIEIKDIFVESVISSFDLVGKAPELDKLEDEIKKQVDNVRENFDHMFDELEQKIGSTTPEEARNEAYASDTGQANMASGGVEGNWLVSKVTGAKDKADNAIEFPEFDPGELKEEFDNFMSNMEKHVSDDISKALENIRLISETSTTTEIISMMASTVIELIRAAAKVAIDIVGDIIVGLISLIKKLFASSAMSNWMSGEVKIPIVTTLYKYLTNSDRMSLLDFVGFLAGFSGMMYEKVKGAVVFKKSNGNEDDPDTIVAVANILQILSGGFGTIETSGSGKLPSPAIRLIITAAARATYFKGIFLKLTGVERTTTLLMWSMPTANLVKDMIFLGQMGDPKKAARANNLAAIFGFGLVTIFVPPMIDPKIELSQSALFFAFIVSVSLLIAPCANSPTSSKAALRVVRGLMIILSGAIGLSAGVVETPKTAT